MCVPSQSLFLINTVISSSVAKGGALGARAPPLARVTCIVDSILYSKP